MALTESLQQQALRELGETVCPNCGAGKKRGHSFCWPCFRTLPEGMRKRLYSTFSEGYPNIYDEAKQWLKIEA
ncbi:MAG: DUF2797 domain-containing protein [Acidobacteria bacterium]|nr:DUF2797 domain-containing protein [Acidobacteriota bacterium]